VIVLREAAGADVVGELAHAVGHRVEQVGIALDEARSVPLADAEQVVEHQHLAVGGRAGPDPDDRDLDALHQRLGHGSRDGLEHEREAARVLERDRVARDLERPLGGAALRLVPAQCGRRLRSEADVAHHGDPGARDRVGARDAGAAALELDGIAAGLLDESLRGRDRLLVRGLVGPERQVADEQRRVQPAAHGGGEHEHLIERDRDGGGVAEHRHGAGVADQDEVDAGRLGGLSAGVVVGGHHHDRLAEALGLGQLRERDRQAVGSWCRGDLGHG
jgi:hypothetical protein